MLIELLSMSNYAHFNVKLAEILGLHPAIYLALIMDINEKAIRKSKINKNFFTRVSTWSPNRKEEFKKRVFKEV